LPTATTAPTSALPTSTTAPGQPTATTAPQATATPAPNETRIALNLGLPGIGPNTNLGQNPNPVRQAASVEVQIFNEQNQKIKDATGTLNFNSSVYGFTGEVSLGTTFETGVYTVKSRLGNTLFKALLGVRIQSAQSNSLRSINLIPGDLDQNNELNLFDYNIMISCYGAKQCNQKEKSDLNIDGKVDELDLNLLYQGFATRQGD
jgi:hypothetical protein